MLWRLERHFRSDAAQEQHMPTLLIVNLHCLAHLAGESESDDEGLPPSYKPNKTPRRSILNPSAANVEDEEVSHGSTSTALPITDATASQMDHDIPVPVKSPTNKTDAAHTATDTPSDSASRAVQHPTAPNLQTQDARATAADLQRQTSNSDTQQQALSSGAGSSYADSYSHPSALLEKATPAYRLDPMAWHHHQDPALSSSSTTSVTAEQPFHADGTQQAWQRDGEAANHVPGTTGLEHEPEGAAVNSGRDSRGWRQVVGQGQNSNNVQEPGQGQGFLSAQYQGLANAPGQTPQQWQGQSQGQPQGQGLGASLAFQQELQQRAEHQEAARAGTLCSGARDREGDNSTIQAVR